MNSDNEMENSQKSELSSPDNGEQKLSKSAKKRQK